MNILIQSARALSASDSNLLVDAFSIVVVDLFRMLYVLGSSEAKATNIDRFPIFFEWADEHKSELDSLITRVAGGLTASNLELITSIERNCRWVLGQIRHRNDVNFDLLRCFRIMEDVASKAYEFFARLIPERLSRADKDVMNAFGRSTIDH